MCRTITAVFVVVFTAAAAVADTSSPDPSTAKEIDKVLRASCRIFAGNARGSGVIFDCDEDSYHVLTNAHVVGRVGNRVRLEFEHSGYRSGPIPGRVVRSHIARNTSIDLAIVELPRSAFPGPMPVVPLAGVGFKDESPTVLTCGAQGGAAVSLQRGHIVRRTRGLIYYKPEALPGRSGSPLFNEDGSRVIGLVAWRTGDGHGLAMSNAAVRSFVRGEVAELETKLPEDAIPLWQSSTLLVLVTSKGCRPCELQKQAIPADVQYHTYDIDYVNNKGYDVKSTPTLMVFVDRKLQEQRSGLLRGDGLQAFLNRWGFRRDGDEPEEDEELHDDDWNPWNNPGRWNRGPIRDRIDDAKTKFAWWLLGKWLGFGLGALAIFVPWVLILAKLWKSIAGKSGGCPIDKRQPRRSPRRKS